MCLVNKALLVQLGQNWADSKTRLNLLASAHADGLSGVQAFAFSRGAM
jgi:hypothetical protein